MATVTVPATEERLEVLAALGEKLAEGISNVRGTLSHLDLGQAPAVGLAVDALERLGYLADRLTQLAGSDKVLQWGSADQWIFQDNSDLADTLSKLGVRHG